MVVVILVIDRYNNDLPIVILATGHRPLARILTCGIFHKSSSSFDEVSSLGCFGVLCGGVRSADGISEWIHARWENRPPGFGREWRKRDSIGSVKSCERTDTAAVRSIRKTCDCRLRPRTIRAFSSPWKHPHMPLFSRVR
ncbi:hypothetical protein CEXT_569421 [Caerostris extrusa]|uniref:Uncharacterized protein n=1 Tax=Caerostris extrusa TaxID=172846 RepID=A0AAV4X4G3_CAEEX|nr:hypothetical protein CEXT_569421 [Caerostris extrusa]